VELIEITFYMGQRGSYTTHQSLDGVALDLSGKGKKMLHLLNGN
jgi:hypothetical protein